MKKQKASKHTYNVYLAFDSKVAKALGVHADNGKKALQKVAREKGFRISEKVGRTVWFFRSTFGGLAYVRKVR